MLSWLCAHPNGISYPPQGGVWQLIWEVNRSQCTRDIGHPGGSKSKLKYSKTTQLIS